MDTDCNTDNVISLRTTFCPECGNAVTVGYSSRTDAFLGAYTQPACGECAESMRYLEQGMGV